MVVRSLCMPNHNPTATMGHFVHNVDISKRLYVVPNSLKTTMQAAYGREINIQFFGNNSGGHSYTQHLNSKLPHNLLCDETAHFRVAFYCPQHKVHLCNDHAV